MWEALRELVVLVRLLLVTPARSHAEEQASPRDVRQSVSAGEAARRASHGPFEKREP